MQSHFGLQVAGPEAQAAFGVEQRREERQTDDVIVMRVREKQVQRQGPIICQAVAEIAKPRSRVEDQNVLAAANLQAGRVAAIAPVFRARASDRTAYPPKSHKEIPLVSQPAMPQSVPRLSIQI